MIRDELDTRPFRNRNGRAVECQDDADRRVGQNAAARCWNAAGHVAFASHEVVSPAPCVCRLSRFSALRQGDDVLPG